MGVRQATNASAYDAQSTALTTDGKGAINTVKVISTMTAPNVLVMTLTNTTGEDIKDIPIMPGSFKCGAAAKLPAGVEGSVQGFDSWEAAIQHFTFGATQVQGLEMTSANTDNLDNTFTFEKKKPSGQGNRVPRHTQGYLTFMGDGKFTPKITLPADGDDAWVFLLEARQRIELGLLKANSKLIMRMYVFGEAGVQELVPFDAATL